MAGALLRSGRLSELRPLGAVGNPVYSSASQLRAAMRLHLGPDVANLFAIPKQHDRGDAIDWYAPEDGDVVPWSAATSAQRTQAKAALMTARDRLAERARSLQEHENQEQKVFGKLLAQALHIPSDEHVYLVADRPVVTFWGFVPIEAPAGLDVIAELDTGTQQRIPAPEPAPVVATPDPFVRRRWPWWWWLLLGLGLLGLLWWLRSCYTPSPLVPSGETEVDRERSRVIEPSPTAIPSGRDSLAVRDGRVVEGGGAGTVVPGDGGLESGTRRVPGELGTEPGTDERDTEPRAALPTPLPGDRPALDNETRDQGDRRDEDGSEPEDQQHSATPTTAPPSPDAPLSPDVPPDSRPDAETLPGTAPDATSPGTDPGTAPGTAPGTDPTKSGTETPLTIPEEARESGSTEFLNGKWRSSTGLQDTSGNPVDLEYDFKDGAGTVSARRSGADQRPVTCSGTVGSRMQNGKVLIDQSAVRCPDGTTFGEVKIECAAGEDDRADCEGRNQDGSEFDVRIAK